VGEGLARVITIGSIVLTVASLTLAFVFARKRSRIRVRFDVARAIIGITAIVVMAAITNVVTPVIAVLVSVAVGIGLGFTQGSTLEISAGKRGLYAKRTPIALVGWGAGIILMQAAGIASRTGAVQLGQTVAWFSACMGIGLIVGRTGPLNKNLARTGVATVIIALILPITALATGPHAPASAQSIQLSRDDVCALTPGDGSWGSVEGELSFNHYDEQTDQFIFFTVSAPDATVECANRLEEGHPDGTWFQVGVLLFPSEAAAAAAHETLASSFRVYATTDVLAGAGIAGGDAVRFDFGYYDRAIATVGPFLVIGGYDGGYDYKTEEYDVILAERMAVAVSNIEKVLPSSSAPPDTSSDDSPSAVPPTPSGDVSDEPDVEGTAAPPPPSASTDPISPEEAAGQAIAGLIAAAAIGLITWGEATGEITRILSGLGGSGNGAPPKPSAPPPPSGPPGSPPPPPLLDENGNQMTVSDGTVRDAAGNPAPAGKVEWVDGYGNVSWISRADAVDRVAAEKAARRANEEWLGRRAREAETTWMDDQRDQASVRRAGEEQAARERAAEREALDDWGRRIQDRDALDRRQGILEADSARKATDEWWWEDFYDEYQRGIKEDMAALPGELYDGTGNAIRWVHGELSDPENWRVAGETILGSAKDAGGLIVGDRATVTKVGGTMQAGAKTAVRIAGVLWDAARDDPAGAAVGVAKAVLGADNWSKVIDKSVPVSERLGRAIWGVFDTGGILMGAGAGAARVLDAVSDLARGADALGDAARATDAISDAARAADGIGDAARAADAAADAARAGDAVGDAARAGGMADDAIRVSDDALDAARAGDAVSDTGRVAGRGKVPGYATDPIDDIRHLPEGAEIVHPRLLAQTGYSEHQIAAMRNLAQKENVIIGARTTNIESARHIRAGRAMPKPIDIKSKTINELDTFLGARPQDKGLVGYFEPRRPDLSKVPDNLHADVLKRYDDRLADFRKYSSDVDRMVQEGTLFPDKVRGVLVDSRTGLPYAGDIDPVFFKDATTGDFLSADRYLEVVEKFKRSGAMGQHGAEVNIIGDLTMGQELGSPEWREAYESAIELQNKLSANHISGAETVVQIGPDGVLRRGPRFDTGLPIAEIARPKGFEV